MARGWGIPAVVGAAGSRCTTAGSLIGERTLAAGDVITIDGSTGEVFDGAIPGATEVVPEAAVLLGWAAGARDRDRGRGGGGRRGRPAARRRPPARKATPDACLRVIGIKGFATTQGVADAVLADAETVEPILDQLAIDGLVATAAGAFRLTDAGTARVGRPARGRARGVGRRSGRRRARRVPGPRSPDEGDRHRLAAPRRGGAASSTTTPMPRTTRACSTGSGRCMPTPPPGSNRWSPAVHGLALYGIRLGRAAAQALAGDGRYVASPRVDSYHGIWFELHEDLIQLAGRTREDEAAAGRA